DWPIPIVKQKKSLLECNTCGIGLCLLAQVYAPISSESLAINERIIYVFGCLTPHCESPFSALAHNPTPNSSSGLGTNLHGMPISVPIASVLSRPSLRRTKISRSTLKMQNRLSRKPERRSRTFGGQAWCSREPSQDTFQLFRCLIAVMPCFYICPLEEKLSKNISNKSSKASLLSMQQCDYTLEDQSTGETYEEENYEYDRALSADRTYLKFKKRVDAYPEQCFRYSYGGKPLLASEETENPGMCNLCGGQRHYELQLMTPLIHFLQEAANDLQRTSLEKFNWMTLLVYTCSKNCADSSYQVKSGSEDWIIAEEAVILQHE
ncbi:programmed cell death 2 C-terminal domain-containing protein, partial [Striga hermonthica]